MMTQWSAKRLPLFWCVPSRSSLSVFLQLELLEHLNPRGDLGFPMSMKKDRLLKSTEFRLLH